MVDIEELSENETKVMATILGSRRKDDGLGEAEFCALTGLSNVDFNLAIIDLEKRKIPIKDLGEFPMVFRSQGKIKANSHAWEFVSKHRERLASVWSEIEATRDTSFVP